MEFIRRNTDYGLRALVYLAREGVNNAIPVRNIAEEEGVSEDFLRKIFQTLAEAKIVRSHRGSKGGFSITKEAKDISVLEVMDALQGPIAINRCFLGKDSCPNFNKCQLKDRLIIVQEGLQDFLGSISIASLLIAEEDAADLTLKKRGG